MFKPFLTKWPFLFKLRFFWLLAIILAVLILFYLKVVPFGRISYQRAWPSGLRSGQGFIFNPTPAERIETKSGQPLSIIGDPVYFSLSTPRTFNQAEIIVTYRTSLSADLPIIEAGVLVDKLVWRYDLKPLENRILDELDWSRISGKGLTLWQKVSTYSDIDQFLADLAKGNLAACPEGATKCLAVYNVNPEFFSPASLMSEPLAPADISQPLRGAHQFYIELAQQPLSIDLDLVDLNQDKAADPISLESIS